MALIPHDQAPTGEITLPLGPDEPEAFTDAMVRILHRLERPVVQRPLPRTPLIPEPQTTSIERLASPYQ